MNSEDFDTLIAPHRQRILNYCIRLMGNHDEGHDAFQETLIKVCSEYGTFRSEGHFISWSMQVAKNTCLNMLRQRNNLIVRNTVALKAEIEDTLVDERHFEQTVQRKNLCEALIHLLKEEAHAGRPRWNTLDWLIFMFYYFQGIENFAEIARRLHVTAGKVQNRFRSRIEPVLLRVGTKFLEAEHQILEDN